MADRALDENASEGVEEEVFIAACNQCCLVQPVTPPGGTRSLSVISCPKDSMRKSFSIDSSMQVLSNHAKPQGLQTLRSLREEREAEEARLYTESLKGRQEQPKPAQGWSLKATLLAVVLAVLGYRLASGALASQLAAAFGGAGNQTAVEGCNGVPVMQSFDLHRFAGRWHHVAWLHSSVLPGAEPFQHRVSTTCTTAGFGIPSGLGGGRGEFDVTFTSRTIAGAAAAGSAVSSPRAEPGTPTVTQSQGRGSTPNATAAAKLQVALHNGPVLPYWVISTDYDKWALMCSTSVTLGGGSPAQVLTLMSRTWALDRLDVGDRLNELASLDLPWKDVAFAPVRECMARMS